MNNDLMLGLYLTGEIGYTAKEKAYGKKRKRKRIVKKSQEQT